MPAATLQLPFWKQVPVFRILLAFVAGILLQHSFNFKLAYALAFTFSALFSFLILNLLSYAARYRFAWLQGLFLQLFLAGAGMYMTWVNHMPNHPSWFGHHYKKGDPVLLTLTEAPTEKPRSYKAEAKVETVAGAGKTTATMGSLIIYFEKRDEVLNLSLGSRLVTTSPINPIYNNSNPGGFNYQRYASMQQLYHTVYIPFDEYQVLEGNGAGRFAMMISAATTAVIEVLRKYVDEDPRILGIAEALLIGYKADLDKDIQQAYSNTGVVHIIAISGMHLGLIYLLLTAIFGKIKFISSRKWLMAISIIAILWFFSFMTGASASVMRSAVMFTILLLGKYFFRQKSSFNALAASALFLLLYDPYWLWDLGFQLSYAAVLGILWLQQPIYKIWFVQNKFLAMAWNALSLTLAAQVLTLPLTIHYFHQFPIIFPISNLVAVPLSSLILYLEIALVALCWIPFLASFLGKVISLAIQGMNFFIEWIDKLPFAKIDNIPSDLFSTLLLTLAIILFAFYLLHRKSSLGIAALVVIITLSSIQVFKIMIHGRQHRVVVYNAGKHAAIDIISGKTYWPLAADSFNNNAALQNFYCRATRIQYRAAKKSQQVDNLYQNGSLLQYRRLKLMVVKEDSPALPASPLGVDAVIITGNPKMKIADLTTMIKPGIVIIAADNPVWKTEQWKRECSALALRSHNVAKQGAYVLNAP